MSETINDTVQGTTGPGLPEFRLSIDATYEMLQKYSASADSTLETLQKNIIAATNQINEWRRYELVIAGQKQLIKDLLTKISGPKEESKVEDVK